MHAHFLPFIDENAALAQQALPDLQRFEINARTERRISLNGTWKFLFSKIMMLVRPISTSQDIVHVNGKT